MASRDDRTVHVEHCMGTVFSLDVRSERDPADAIAEVVAWLHRVDRVFSTYRADSDVSRLGRRELRLADAAPEVAEVFGLCAEVRRTTGGWFDPLVAGRIDPTGLVKGWAVERAAQLLEARGFTRYALNGGGDVRVAGGAAGDRPWRIGVTDPRDPGGTLTTVELIDGAVATSGTAERGDHIVDPFTGRPVTVGLQSATVVGSSLTFVDAYATACFAMGDDAAFAWIAGVAGHELLVVDAAGALRRSGAPVR